MTCWLEDSPAVEGFTDTVVGAVTAVGGVLALTALARISMFIDRKKNPMKADAIKAINALSYEEATMVYLGIIDKYPDKVDYDADQCIVFNAYEPNGEFDENAYFRYRTFEKLNSQKGFVPDFIRGREGLAACKTIIGKIKQYQDFTSLSAKIDTVTFPNGLCAVIVKERNRYAKQSMDCTAYVPVNESDDNFAFKTCGYDAIYSMECQWQLFLQYYNETKTAPESPATEGYFGGAILGIAGLIVGAGMISDKMQKRRESKDPYFISRNKLYDQLKTASIGQLAESVAMILKMKKNRMVVTGTPAKNLCMEFESAKFYPDDPESRVQYDHRRVRNVQDIWYVMFDTSYGEFVAFPTSTRHSPSDDEWTQCFMHMNRMAIVEFFMENMDVIQKALNDAGSDIQIAVESDTCWLSE